MKQSLPKMNMDKSETGCCPRFDPAPWDGAEFDFHDRPFVRATTINFLHVPLNIGSMIKRTWGKIEKAGAAPSDEFLMLSTDPSPWTTPSRRRRRGSRRSSPPWRGTPTSSSCRTWRRETE